MESHARLTPSTPSATTDATDLAKAAAAFWPISAHPFREVGTVDDLIEKGLPPAPWLNAPGVYAIVAPVGYEFEALDDETANSVPIEVLRSRWVSAARVLYVGVADKTTLRHQIDALIDHAAGDTTDDGPRRNGETVWQLAGYEAFMVMAMATTDPAALEATLLAQFAKRFGCLPFGNRATNDDPNATTPNAVQRILDDARKAIVIETIRTSPQDVTIGELRQALTKRGLEDAFLSVTFGEMRHRRGEPALTLDEEIVAILKNAGSLKAEDIRDALDATPDQIRAAMKRLAALGIISIEEERRGTTYVLNRESAASH